MQISSFLKTVLQQDSSVIKSHPFFSGTERETPLRMEISFICVNAPQKNNSTLSSEFLLCLFLKNTINSQQSFCQRALFWSDTLCYPFSLFYFCIFEMFLKIYRKLKRKKKKTKIEQNGKVTQCVTPEQGSLAERLL